VRCVACELEMPFMTPPLRISKGENPCVKQSTSFATLSRPYS
jgi:hypothetical protein